jgi:hypothetical protein
VEETGINSVTPSTMPRMTTISQAGSIDRNGTAREGPC